MNIILTHPNAKLPVKANPLDRAYDITAISREIDAKNNRVIYDTGLRMEFPPNVAVDIKARSSINKYDLVLANSIGTIDMGYRGNLMVIFKPILSLKHLMTFLDYRDLNLLTLKETFLENEFKLYEVGDKIAQIEFELDYEAVYGEVDFNVVESFSNVTQRNEGGFGSSGI